MPLQGMHTQNGQLSLDGRDQELTLVFLPATPRKAFPNVTNVEGYIYGCAVAGYM